MDVEQCREAVLSEEYRDFMLTDRFFSLLREGTYLTQPAGTLYQNVYLPRSEAERFPENDIPYYSIPKCFTPLDMGALNAAGITTVQNYPGLELKGQGMLIGFLDTGIDYTNPVFRSLDGSTGFWGSGTRPFRTAIRRKDSAMEVPIQEKILTSTAAGRSVGFCADKR